MSYSTQLLTEAVQGRHNILDFVEEEIATLPKGAIDSAIKHAKSFLTADHNDHLGRKARIEEITLLHSLDEASELIVHKLLEAIILIKPEILIRGGKETIYPGIAPMQSIATQIGLAIHHDQLDAVQTGIELLAHFEDFGIYSVRVTREADRAINRNGHIEVHGDSAIITPVLDVSLNLYHRVQATRYLPPMLVCPATLSE